jgi:hypothetical protein
MESAMDTADIRRIVRETVERQFPKEGIVDVVVRPDTDSYGDEVLRITVVLADRKRDLDQDRLVGLVRHLRSRLADVQQEAFPLLTFISDSDAKKWKLETA